MRHAHVAAVTADSGALAPYGRRVAFTRGGPGVVESSGPDFVDFFSRSPLIDGPGHLGLTIGPPLPATVRRMERHLHTGEAMFCLDRPVILPVAAAGADRPRTEDVRAFLINPGECVVIDRGVWHAPCIGVDGPSKYYWFAAVDETIPDDWVELDDGPVAVELAESSLP